MNHEQLLVSKIIEEGDLLGMTEAGLRPEYFLDPKARSVYQSIIKYHTDYGSVPTYDRIVLDYPNFNWESVAEPVEDLYDLTIKGYRLAVLEECISDAVDLFDAEDDQGVANTLHTGLSKMAVDSRHVRDTDITKTAEDRLKRYESYKSGAGKIRGIETGFRAIDLATQGMQSGQLVTLVGPPKAGKSTSLLLIARTAHMAAKSVLFVGFEMSNEEQEDRLDAISAKVSHHRLRSGELNAEEMKRLKRSVHSIEGMKPFIFSNDAESTMVLSGIQAKIQKYKPDLVIIDGVYMMQDENGENPGSPQALTNITRGFKRMARSEHVPIIITTQVLGYKMDRRRGITADSIGYSSSFAQDSDAIIGVENTDDPQVKKVKIVIARNCPPLETFIEWDWETGEFVEREDYDPSAGEDTGSEYAGARF